MLNYDQKKDLNKSETLSTRCVQRQKVKCTKSTFFEFFTQVCCHRTLKLPNCDDDAAIRLRGSKY